MKALLGIVFTCILTFGCDYSRNQSLFSNDVDTLLLRNSRLDSLMRVDSLLFKEEIQKIKFQARVELDSLKNVYENKPITSNSRYYVIAGSFKKEKNAKRFAERIKQYGFNSTMLLSNEGFYLVSSSRHETLQQAIVAQNHMRSSISVEAWIYVEK